jgi:hypothetical protein
MRPTFRVELSTQADEAIERIGAALAASSDDGRSVSAGRCAELFVDERHRRIWSPHLSVQVEESEQGSVLLGRFSPRPEIWTLLMFLYFFTVTVVFFAAMLGCAQWMIGQTVWGLWVAAAGVLVIAGLHTASLIGQRLSREQMEQLRSRLDHVLSEAFPAEAET